jgi:hypothetical protein
MLIRRQKRMSTWVDRSSFGILLSSAILISRAYAKLSQHTGS